jgi:3D (Asp-Asp-Asp) domain-containing protein
MNEYSSRLLRVVATAYCPCAKCCGECADGVTATGRDAKLPGVAVDKSVIALGSRIDIPHYFRGPNKNGSWILADDVGGAIKKDANGNDRIDVRFSTHREAKQWGTKKIKIRIWTKV